MSNFGKILFSLVLIALALLTDGVLAVPAFVAFIALWGIK
jgi:hypothetical protein